MPDLGRHTPLEPCPQPVSQTTGCLGLFAAQSFLTTPTCHTCWIWLACHTPLEPCPQPVNQTTVCLGLLAAQTTGITYLTCRNIHVLISRRPRNHDGHIAAKNAVTATSSTMSTAMVWQDWQGYVKCSLKSAHRSMFRTGTSASLSKTLLTILFRCIARETYMVWGLQEETEVVGRFRFASQILLWHNCFTILCCRFSPTRAKPSTFAGDSNLTL